MACPMTQGGHNNTTNKHAAATELPQLQNTNMLEEETAQSRLDCAAVK